MGWAAGAPGAGPENGFGRTVCGMPDGRGVRAPSMRGMADKASNRDPELSRQRASRPDGR